MSISDEPGEYVVHASHLSKNDLTVLLGYLTIPYVCIFNMDK